VTEQPESRNPNGFLALAEFDKPESGGNGDGIIDRRDKVFSHLVLWIDENHDGISQPNELHSLPELGVYSLALRYQESRRTDEFGNRFRYKAAVNPDPNDGESRDGRITYDVFFVEEGAAKPHAGSVPPRRALRRRSLSWGGSYQYGELNEGLAFVRSDRNKGRNLADISAQTSHARGEAMKTPALLMAGICSMASALCAQQVATAPTINLKANSKVGLPLSRNFQMNGKTKCDDVGRIYGRPMDLSPEKGPKAAFTAAIRLITPKGDLAETFDLPARWRDSTQRGGIFVSADGRVFQAVDPFPDVFVVEFAKDGSVNSKIKLQTGTEVVPWHLAVFKSGRFLLSGEAGEHKRTPYTAVFEPDGRLLKKIYEPEDEEARGKAEIGDDEFADPNLGNGFVNRDFADACLDRLEPHQVLIELLKHLHDL